MKNKIVSIENAVSIIRDGDTLCFSGFGSNGVSESPCRHVGKAIRCERAAQICRWPAGPAGAKCDSGS